MSYCFGGEPKVVSINKNAYVCRNQKQRVA
jgi:hypothetical protein